MNNTVGETLHDKFETVKRNWLIILVIFCLVLVLVGVGWYIVDRLAKPGGTVSILGIYQYQKNDLGYTGRLPVQSEAKNDQVKPLEKSGKVKIKELHKQLDKKSVSDQLVSIITEAKKLDAKKTSEKDIDQLISLISAVKISDEKKPSEKDIDQILNQLISLVKTSDEKKDIDFAKEQIGAVNRQH